MHTQCTARTARAFSKRTILRTQQVMAHAARIATGQAPRPHQTKRSFTLRRRTTNVWEVEQSIRHALRTIRRNCDCYKSMRNCRYRNANQIHLQISTNHHQVHLRRIYLNCGWFSVQAQIHGMSCFRSQWLVLVPALCPGETVGPRGYEGVRMCARFAPL